MANKLVSDMCLPPHLAHLLAARRLTTAKDVLSLPEVELMSLLDAGLATARDAVCHVSEFACPPCQTVPRLASLAISGLGVSERLMFCDRFAQALALLDERVRLGGGGRLATTLCGLDEALGGGIPLGKLTEVVGPSGIGKTQFCLKLALLATLPECYGGLNGRVVYIDTESKFSSRRMIEICQKSFPQIFRQEGLAQKMAGRILVMRPASLSDFTKSLEQMKVTLLQNDVKLLIVDSVAAFMSSENERGTTGFTQHPLRWALSFLKSIAELTRIPVVVSNQVRSQSNDDGYHYSFEVKRMGDGDGAERLESHLVAALGIQWAHAVTIRLVFESHSGQRFIKVAKSPMSPAVAFPFIVESSGITLLNDEGIDVSGPEITSIRCQGQNLLGLLPLEN
ncbi:DNA repair protein RAD51 homolog 2-like isoform X1 [Triticum dicoccoides]|nr:DNA repair protein RAD51 homolog 2-like isoform X1 [Triticum dicoccoides]